MNEQTMRECIKALAYGCSRDEVCAVMNVSAEDVNGITEKETRHSGIICKRWGISNEQID